MNIVLSNITPPVIPEIGLARSKDETKAILIVRIHQSHETPHAKLRAGYGRWQPTTPASGVTD